MKLPGRRTTRDLKCEVTVVKCRTTRRRPEGQQWSKEAIQKMKGSVQQLVPGIESDRIPIGRVDSNGEKHPVLKPTVCMTNSTYNSQALPTRCGGQPKHTQNSESHAKLILKP